MQPTTDGMSRLSAALPRALLALMLFLVLAGVLPLLGAISAGTPITPLLAFPPTTVATDVPDFAAPVAFALAIAIAAVLAPFVYRWWRAGRAPTTPVRAFPLWGWAGVALVAASWFVAWTRLPALADVQRYSFTPLWIGYIVALNALSYRRSGRCLLCDRPAYFALLFPLSAVFWWYFEYLNRFVRNWYYEGVDGMSAAQYVLEASVPFATVLPAVLSTAEWLGTFTRGQRAFGDWHRLSWVGGRIASRLAFILGAAGLVAIGRWPELTYPLVWVAPFLLLYALQALPGHRPLAAALAHGDWRPIVLPALAALICGFFWELWNYGSLARWVYTVPYLTGVRVFEMPLLGYAGYLPFGLACAAVADLFHTVATPPRTGLDCAAPSWRSPAVPAHAAEKRSPRDRGAI